MAKRWPVIPARPSLFILFGSYFVIVLPRIYFPILFGVCCDCHVFAALVTRVVAIPRMASGILSFLRFLTFVFTVLSWEKIISSDALLVGVIKHESAFLIWGQSFHIRTVSPLTRKRGHQRVRHEAQISRSSNGKENVDIILSCSSYAAADSLYVEKEDHCNEADLWLIVISGDKGLRLLSAAFNQHILTALLLCKLVLITFCFRQGPNRCGYEFGPYVYTT